MTTAKGHIQLSLKFQWYSPQKSGKNPKIPVKTQKKPDSPRNPE